VLPRAARSSRAWDRYLIRINDMVWTRSLFYSFRETAKYGWRAQGKDANSVNESSRLIKKECAKCTPQSIVHEAC
jgi:hypothetical protein